MNFNTGHAGKYHLLTYGCQMNVRDSEIIAGILDGMGYILTPTLKEADLVVFNTCSVRHSAENKVYGKLGEVTLLKRDNPDMLIAVGGCMAQLANVRARLKKQKVDIVFGTNNLHELPHLINQAKNIPGPVVQVYDREGDIVEHLPSRRDSNLSAFVNIMYGCNNFCSYCIVPFTRGRERSRMPADIITEIRNLAEQGFKEVTLLGQNVNSYGRGLQKPADFADLLNLVNEIEGIERIRFTTSHPRDMTDKLIDAIAVQPKVCEHIHVAMQSGSNHILKRMNRGYTREHYLERTQRIREMISGAAITTDIIVGFPGESESDFQDTMDMVNKIRFDAAFTFMYSVRTGTTAATMDDQVPLDIRRERLISLNKLQYSIAREINKSLEGTIQEVLVEGLSKTDKDKLTSRTRTNRIVIFSGPRDLIGRLISVKITEAKTFSLFGEIM
ncbi:trna-i(6)a37 methylthiotransferase [hydrocarbon metagenome]|uniref:Trna-i(6)a37 methylthiotransferase n=1 Tax=hydrocarbon metagenome TaxID=938273 RepID=A0A0W8E874_9ZZZZ